MNPEQSVGTNVVSKLTHKAVARAAGYYAWMYAGKWSWQDQKGWSSEQSVLDAFDTEEAAYKDCCEACGLVEKDFTGLGGPR